MLQAANQPLDDLDHFGRRRVEVPDQPLQVLRPGRRSAKLYAAMLKHAELAIIDGGHITVVQAPDAIAQAMRNFFLKQ